MCNSAACNTAVLYVLLFQNDSINSDPSYKMVTLNREINCMTMHYKLERIALFHCMNFQAASHLVTYQVASHLLSLEL